MRCLIPLTDEMGNAEVGVLLDAPLLEPMPDSELCLTSDEWVSLLAERTRAGHPLHFAEVRLNG
ncbi:hypothetical protein [Stenotrophomonas sp. PS02298]|uniref:hypothetical protein n=1 Tax=Stenotrophomonas sp. PS02298 TaxID=2991424 RepID=UPI00249CA977|nr:hypothetical protein [Stenotrophomonas sp. PS02298]